MRARAKSNIFQINQLNLRNLLTKKEKESKSIGRWSADLTD